MTVRNLNFTQGGGDDCTKDRKYSVTFEINCNENKTTRPANKDFTVDETDGCRPVIRLDHAAGCPVANLASIAIFF